MDVNTAAGRRAFSIWLRTGLWRVPDPDDVELKFNPYHDPRNGQFTFAPGGSRALSRVVISRGTAKPDALLAVRRSQAGAPASPGEISPTVYRPAQSAASFITTGAGRPPGAPPRSGGNIQAFQIPMTLEQVFPGLRTAPGGAIVALADNLLDFTGPARALTSDLTLAYSNRLIGDIRAINPDYRYDSLGFPQTLEGQKNQLNDLRFDRAEAFMRFKEELRPLQTETLRFVQESADRAYEQGLKLLNIRRLRVRLSEREALGNYVDRQVRLDLRERFGLTGIDSAGQGPVRVNRRENNSTDGTYRRPDARVGAIAFDVTLTAKNARTPQVRGFFDADFRPTHVIIIRPRQLGSGSTYIISRGTK